MVNRPTNAESEKDPRSRMLRRGPAVPGKIEKAHQPRQALARLVPYLGPYKTTLAVVLVFVVIATGLGLAGPYLLGRAIDGYIATGDTVGLAVIASWMLARRCRRRPSGTCAAICSAVCSSCRCAFSTTAPPAS
jgi:hypothetical protein